MAVIGGGQAGLAIGHFLRQHGYRFVILERASELAPAWRERWDSLTLFTPRRYSALPGLPFAGDPDGYATRDEVIAYLERYAETFELPVELNSEVKRLDQDDDGRFRLAVGGRTIIADQVVVATGPFQTPYVPKLGEKLAGDLFQTHAVGYRKPGDVPEGTVLVVGGGNTGFQIAKELSATHKVVLSIGSQSKAAAPARARAGPLLVADQDAPHQQDGRVTPWPQAGHARHADRLEPARDDGALRRRAQATACRRRGPAGALRRRERTRSRRVIWATGYRSDYSWIKLPIFDEDGRLRHRRGVTDVPGLHFLGLTWQHTRGSALIGFIKDDAEFIAEKIAVPAIDRPAEAGHRSAPAQPAKPARAKGASGAWPRVS